MAKKFELSGVYIITNKVNGKFYVGSGVSVFSRWLNHASYLKNDTHINYKLQRAFNKYGFDNFTFEILEMHEPDGLNVCEQSYLDTLCKAQEYIRGESTFFNQKTYNIKPLVWGTTGLPNKLESSIRASRTRGFDRILKVHKNGGVISVYELKEQASEDNKIDRTTVSRSIKERRCPRFKDYYFTYEKDYDETFKPKEVQAHNKGVVGTVTHPEYYKEVFCYDIYGRFFKKFESNKAVAEYFDVNTSSTCRMIDSPKKKILHRHGVHLYNLFSTEQSDIPNKLEDFQGVAEDGDIGVYNLFHEFMGAYSSNTISSIIGCLQSSVGDSVKNEKVLKGFYFIRDKTLT